MSQQTNFSDNEKKIYQLLYENPICERIKSNELNVLIVGNDNNFEAFRTVFWCGQYPDTTLNITVCCDSIDDCEKRLKTQMPSIGEFVNFKGNNSINNPLANVFFITEYDDKEYDYVLILKDISSQSDENEELKRLAENINFAYALKENERANFKKITGKLYDETDEKNIYDQKSSYASAVHIASKLKYCESHESIPTNISEKEKKEKAVELLVKAINTGKDISQKTEDDALNQLYNNLVVLEHHRWMAYTISEGWKRPTKDELDKYLYDGTNDHKNKTEKYHACLYDCGDEIKDLTNSLNRIFQEKDSPHKLENLDDVSLYCYKVLCEKTKNIDIDRVFNLNFDRILQSKKTVDSNLNQIYHLIIQMRDNVDNSVKLYRNEMKNIEEKQPELYKILKDELKPIEKTLKLLEERAKKNNFFEIDAQLINFIPFCLWYRKKYKAVITISDRNVVDDIAVPILLGAEHHTVLLKTKKGYSDKINAFLRTYYDTDKDDDIIKIDIKDSKYLKNDSAENDYIKNYQEAIDERISYFTNRENILEEDIVINIVPHSIPEAIMAIEKYKNTHPIVSYRQSGIKCFNNMMNDYYKIGNINLSVDEWLQLCDWTLTTQGYGVMSCDKMDELSGFFWKVSERTKIDGKPPYTIWQKMHNCYEKKYDGNISWHILSRQDEPYQKDVNDNIPKFLKILEKEKIIENLKTYEDRQYAEFDIKDEEAYGILSYSSGTFFENIVYYKCKYSTLFYEVRTGVKIEVKNFNNVDKNNNSNTIDTNNEIDVIAIKDTKPVFVSCKSTAELKKEFIYEIHSEAKLFGGIPVLAVSQTLAEKKFVEGKRNIISKDETFTERAKDWGVSLLDANIIKDDEKFNRAMKRILAGEIVSPVDAEFHTQQEDKK